MIELPAAYDIVWSAIPLLWSLLTGVMIYRELSVGSSVPRVILWVVAHLILPFIVFVIWMFYRFSESRKAS
ncbi:hypothetical protein [Corynebacterium doosanense]|uniref:Uncharacterized protein n=1 Tax=Corynebacterium doosanense CAU 212 = DSM 45436 TaxID=558173 RepID=A0A097IJN0_9CORY|nr:hypothetical protein [Corynebacterium doosanense]AIT62324.1 hypothetical protein CDOO_11450 [Corynebacterium doosanense CAU 212 = DSM 45436]